MYHGKNNKDEIRVQRKRRTALTTFELYKLVLQLVTHKKYVPGIIRQIQLFSLQEVHYKDLVLSSFGGVL